VLLHEWFSYHVSEQLKPRGALSVLNDTKSDGYGKLI